MAQPKGKKSNNQKKEAWYCSTSKSSLLRLIRAIGILDTFDVLHPPKIPEGLRRFAEEDILGLINRECRMVRIEKKIRK